MMCNKSTYLLCWRSATGACSNQLKAMVFVQKLPTLEPEMRGALRAHIIRRRQRLKQEQEQDAIEKRLKKEKELRQIQDAMTLDQIKEQLTTLERRLETLREEKHNLFIQLKQVLNDDDSRRKQESTQDKKESDGSSIAPASNGVVNHSLDLKRPVEILQKQIKQPPPQTTASSINNAMVPRAQDLTSPVSKPIPVITAAIPNIISHNPNIRRPVLAHSGSLSGTILPPAHHHHPYPPNSSSAIQLTNMKPNLASNPFISSDSHSNSKLQLTNRIQDFKEAPNLPINFDQHTLSNQYDARRIAPMDVPISLKTTQHDINMLNYAGTGANSSKRSLASANLPSDIHLNDRIFARKKPNNFIFPNSNQFYMNGLPNDVVPNFSQYNTLGPVSNPPGPSISGSSLQVPSSMPNLIGVDHLARKPLSLPPQIHQPSNHPLGPNFDLLMMNQSKPGLLLAGINPFYPADPSFNTSQSQLNPHINPELRNFSSPFPPIGPQPYGNNPRFLNPPLGLPQDHHPNRYPFPTNFNYGPRGSVPPKNFYHPK